MTEPMIAYCGLVCTGCPLFIAAGSNDKEKARVVVLLLKREYGIDAAIEDIYCDGCRAEGRLYAGCARCEIRPCAIARGVATCGRCADFPCPTIETFLEAEPSAREVLFSEKKGR